jgi:hypothetical protein
MNECSVDKSKNKAFAEWSEWSERVNGRMQKSIQGMAGGSELKECVVGKTHECTEEDDERMHCIAF